MAKNCVWLVVWTLLIANIKGDEPCGDWIPYKEESCIQVLHDVGPQQNKGGSLACQDETSGGTSKEKPNLVTIKTEEKLKFVRDLIFDQMDIHENVWLGVEMGDDYVFRWKDGTELSTTNLAQPYFPDSSKRCVQMESGTGIGTVGLWVPVSCRKLNAVVCEQPQDWTMAKLRKALETLQSEVDRNDKENEALKDELDKNKQETEHKIANIRAETKAEVDRNDKENKDTIAALKDELEKNKQETEHKMATMRAETKAEVNRNDKDNEDKIAALKDELDKNKQEAEHKIATIRAETKAVVDRNDKANEDKIVALKDELDKNKQETENKLATIRAETRAGIGTATQTSVPVGFIYVQLPGQSAPSILWPHTIWKDVSQSYAGLFFRVDGGNAAPFGREQSENTRHLAGVENGHSGGDGHTDPLPTNGPWSNYVLTGASLGKSISLRFRFNDGEIRPRNKAVKIWIRTK